MKPLLASMQNELQKLFAKKLTVAFLIGAVIIPIIVKLIAANLFILDWMALPAENINFFILDFFIKMMLPLFIFVSATNLFTREAENGTLLPIRPVSRLELFLSKFAAIAIMVGIQLLLGCLSVVICSLFFNINFLLEDTLLTISAYLLSWIPLLTLIAFAVALSLMVKSSVITISIMVMSYLVMLVLPIVYSDVLYMLPSSYLDWYMQWLGDVSPVWAAQSFIYMSSFAVLFMTMAYYFFEKKQA